MIPPAVFSSAGAAFTITLSCKGVMLTFLAIIVLIFCFFCICPAPLSSVAVHVRKGGASTGDNNKPWQKDGEGTGNCVPFRGNMKIFQFADICNQCNGKSLTLMTNFHLKHHHCQNKRP